jgi:hypothetical protein
VEQVKPMSCWHEVCGPITIVVRRVQACPFHRSAKLHSRTREVAEHNAACWCCARHAVTEARSGQARQSLSDPLLPIPEFGKFRARFTRPLGGGYRSRGSDGHALNFPSFH